MASLFDISRTKHRLILVFAFSSVLSKFLTKKSASFHPRIGSFYDPSSFDRHKTSFPLLLLLCFGWFRRVLKPNLGHNTWINFLQLLGNFLWVISMVKQNKYLSKINYTLYFTKARLNKLLIKLNM